MPSREQNAVVIVLMSETEVGETEEYVEIGVIWGRGNMGTDRNSGIKNALEPRGDSVCTFENSRAGKVKFFLLRRCFRGLSPIGSLSGLLACVASNDNYREMLGTMRSIIDQMALELKKRALCVFY